MTDAWDEVDASTTTPRAARLDGKPLHMVAGLLLGVTSAVLHPGLIMVLPVLWLIPAAIAGVLWVIKPARSLAAGFAAAGLAWLTFYATFWLYVAFAG